MFVRRLLANSYPVIATSRVYAHLNRPLLNLHWFSTTSHCARKNIFTAKGFDWSQIARAVGGNSATAATLLLVAGGLGAVNVSLAKEDTEADKEAGGAGGAGDEEGRGYESADVRYFPKGLTILNKASASVMLTHPQTDVVVAVVASGCPVCKLFKIAYEQVAAALSDTPIVVAIIDGTNFDPAGFTEEESKRVPRIRVYKKGKLVDDDDAGVVYNERTVGPKDLIRFIHTHTSESFDVEQACSEVDQNVEEVKARMIGASNDNVEAEAKTSMTLQLSSLSPCATKMKELYIQWTLRDYPEYSEYDEKFHAAMKCLGSQENEDFWVDVVEIATDNIRVIDKAQKKKKKDAGKEDKKDHGDDDEDEE